MDLLDALIIIVVLGVAARGVRSGLFRQAGSLGGFAVGLGIGAVLAPVIAGVMPSTLSRVIITLTVVFGAAILLSGLGELAGIATARLANKWRLGILDQIGGAVFGAIVALVVVWLLGSMFVRVSSPALAREIDGSVILRTLDRGLPPAPDFIARVERVIAPNGFPRVFAGLEPTPAAPVTGPNAAAINQAAAAGRAATVKIEGDGCGGVVEGSGFVVAPGLVATNAHVVAGISRPVVTDSNGTHNATTVAFDPDMDVAVLRVSGLAAAPLPLASSDVARGTVGAVLGYPGDGPFTIEGAAVLTEQTAVGRNIYDRGIVTRDIYQLQANVRPGNSGGPLITPDGVVVGIVFAASTVQPDIGYALTSTEVRDQIQAARNSGAVSTGACAAE